MAHILVVEDDTSVMEMLCMHLELVGHICLRAQDAAQARMLLAGNRADMALLDVMLPGEDGFSLGETLIAQGMPVLFVTAKTAVSARVHGLRMGAQDYILKPFEPAELLARVENVLRRMKREETSFACPGLMVDFEARRVLRNGQEIPMTAMEFDLLAMLVRRRNVAMSREELLSGVWGYDYAGETRTVDVHIQRLRGKIGAEYIETVYKYGYRFNDRAGDMR